MKPVGPVAPAVVVAALAVLNGCSGSNGSDSSVIVSDSAGIAIVTSLQPQWAPGQEWEIGPEPTLVLGGSDASAGEELWRISALAQSPDGRIAVALAEASEVRVYDTNGQRTATFGRAGEGPGEFERPFSVAIVPPDTALVLDLRRIQTFLLNGTFLGAESVGSSDALGAGTGVRPVRILPDRSMLGSANRFRRGPPRPGVYRPDEAVAVFPSIGATPVLAGWFGGIEQERLETGSGQRSIVAPFARHTAIAAGGVPETRYAVGDNARYEIRVYDASGSLRQIVRRQYEPIPVRSEWIEAWKDEQRRAEWTRGQLPELERGWALMTVPETLSAFDALHVDTEGNLWVQQVAIEIGDWFTYDVFASDGSLLGPVRVPSGFRAFPHPFITDSTFIGVWTDDLNIESVRVYGIRKPQ